jgi:hypothetical protein
MVMMVECSHLDVHINYSLSMLAVMVVIGYQLTITFTLIIR